MGITEAELTLPRGIRSDFTRRCYVKRVLKDEWKSTRSKKTEKVSEAKGIIEAKI